jgi:nitrile hydratase
VNGVHDMGGAQAFGPVVPEAGEPQFHHAWERRVFALTLAMGASGAWNLDQSRAARESLPPAQYLASSYYAIWLEGLCRLMLERGLVTPDELRDGQVHAPPRALPRVLARDAVAQRLAQGAATERAVPRSARFQAGEAVRTRNLHPPSHTRLPRYCRGKRGTIAAVHGAHVFADAHAQGSEDPQWLYTVRFEGRELWGTDTTAACVHVDCFEPYLERVS